MLSLAQYRVLPHQPHLGLPCRSFPLQAFAVGRWAAVEGQDDDARVGSRRVSACDHCRQWSKKGGSIICNAFNMLKRRRQLDK